MDPETAERLYKMREPHYALAKLHVSTDQASPDSVADEIIGVLRKS